MVRIHHVLYLFCFKCCFGTSLQHFSGACARLLKFSTGTEELTIPSPIVTTTAPQNDDNSNYRLK